MIAGVQIIGIVFSFSMIYLAILHFRRKEINLKEMMVWFTTWSFVLVVTLFPDIIQTFSRSFLFVRLFDMMVCGAFILVIVLASKAYIKANKMENKLNEFIDNDAKKLKKG